MENRPISIDEQVNQNNDDDNNDVNLSDSNDPVMSDALRRETPKYRGIYIEGRVQGVDVNYTVDTGASCTIVSDKVFQQIPEDERPTLCQPRLAHSLTSADGKLMKCWGKTELDLELGTLSLKCEVSIAEIEDEVLLGADVLQQKGKPADLLLSKGVMVMFGVEIPLQQIPQVQHVFKVRAALSSYICQYETVDSPSNAYSRVSMVLGNP